MALQIASFSLSGSIFHRFPDLPLELRLQIWQSAIDTPRMITLGPVSKDNLHTRVSKDSIYAEDFNVRPLLHVNREARKAALSTYYTDFYSEDGSEIVPINPKVDTFYLDGISASFGEHEISKCVRSIALPFDYRAILADNVSTSQVSREIKLLRDIMPALEEVQVVVWNEFDRSRLANCAATSGEVDVWLGSLWSLLDGEGKRSAGSSKSWSRWGGVRSFHRHSLQLRCEL